MFQASACDDVITCACFRLASPDSFSGERVRSGHKTTSPSLTLYILSSFLLQPQQATPSPVATPKLPSLPDHPAINTSNGGNEKPNVGDHHGSDMGEAEEDQGADQRADHGAEQGNEDDAGDEDLKKE